MKLILICFTIISVNVCFAQIDYNEIRDNLIRTIDQSKDTLDKNVSFIDSVAKLDIGLGKELFLFDYGWVYRQKYLHSRKQTDLLVSTCCYSQCWEEFSNSEALYRMASNYGYHNCALSKKYYQLFLDIKKQRGESLTEPQIFEIPRLHLFLCSE
ncbi:MAG: hypothetical protein QNK23_03560 [Crocinitomicaceae bacterium]|nr:hypothetical protein [Crocinitomicaceae bacterium]